jgi:hypothetical protein
MMPDREKVIRGLEAHANPKTCETCAGEDCPYYNSGGSFPKVTCSSFLAADALALLKEQEPRVLSKSEAEQYVTNGITDGYSETPPLYVEYKKPNRYFLKWVTLETAHSWMTDYGTSHVYGSELRFWTSRPTPELMLDTPWEGENDE